ncbi:MAG: hypothetical protein WBE98_17095 [Gammaproteobacteria bacterium]
MTKIARHLPARPRLAAFAAAVSLTAAPLAAQPPEPSVADGRPLVSVRELMEKTITPVTNTLWNAFEPPQSEDEWLRLEEAGVTLLVAAQALALGGTGPMDAEWAKNPAWRAYNQAMTTAAFDALRAVRGRDHDALLAAGDALLAPCEGCHQQFNPGVIGEQ